MSATSNQEEMKKYERSRDLVFAENNQAFDAVMENSISKMKKLFNTGGIEQGAIDWLIFYARSVKMMKLFLRFGGDMDKPGPRGDPRPITLLLNCTALLDDHAADSIERRDLVKLIEFLIEEGADVNAVEENGNTPFINCATGGETELCKMLVDRGAVPSAKRNKGTNALHMATQYGSVAVCRYLVEDCGLDIEANDQEVRPRTPLFLASLNGNIEVCIYLLKRGAKVDAGVQPLLGASQVYFFLITLEWPH
jgi:ankyrin repeat protein